MRVSVLDSTGFPFTVTCRLSRLVEKRDGFYFTFDLSKVLIHGDLYNFSENEQRISVKVTEKQYNKLRKFFLDNFGSNKDGM